MAVLASVGIVLGGSATGGAEAATSPTLVGGTARVSSEASLELVVPPDPRRPTIKVTVAVPAGLAAVRCSAGPDWKCKQTPPDGVGPATIEWARTKGTSSVERFSFALQTPPTPGRYPLAVTRTAAPAVTVHFDALPGALGPAPVLHVLEKVPATSTTAHDAKGSGRGAAVSGGVAAFVAAVASSFGVLWWRRRRRAAG
jgi:hypothetical protein